MKKSSEIFANKNKHQGKKILLQIKKAYFNENNKKRKTIKEVNVIDSFFLKTPAAQLVNYLHFFPCFLKDLLNPYVNDMNKSYIRTQSSDINFTYTPSFHTDQSSKEQSFIDRSFDFYFNKTIFPT